MREGEIKILNAFKKEGAFLSNSDIKKLTGLSSPSLSENLKRLMSRGILHKNASNKYHFGVVLEPKGTLENNMVFTLIESHSWAWRISMLRFTQEQELRAKLASQYVPSISLLLLANIWNMLIQSIEHKDRSIIQENVDNYLSLILNSIRGALENSYDLKDVFQGEIADIESSAQEALDLLKKKYLQPRAA